MKIQIVNNKIYISEVEGYQVPTVGVNLDFLNHPSTFEVMNVKEVFNLPHIDTGNKYVLIKHGQQITDFELLDVETKNVMPYKLYENNLEIHSQRRKEGKIKARLL